MTRNKGIQQGRTGDHGAALAVGLGLLALLVRALYLIESGDNPFRLHLDLDPRNYHEWAQAIGAGRPFGEGPFLQAPLYPYFLAGCYAILGVDLLRPLWVQAILAAGTTCLGALIAYRHWGRDALVVTGLVLALHAPAIFYTGVLLVPVLATFLVALSLWIAPRRPWLAGILAGVAALAHPTILPGTLLVVLVMATAPGRSLPNRRSILAIVIGVIVGIVPATVYNLVRSGSLVPISANAGINLFIGNGPGANGFYSAPLGMRGEVDPCGIAEAGRLAGRPLDPTQANRFWIQQTTDAVADQPGRVSGLVAGKFLAALGAFEIPQIESFDFEKRFSWLLRLPLLPNWILLVLLTTAALAFRPRDRLLWSLAGAVFLTAGVLAAFFVTARFRLPAHLFLALASGAAITGALEVTTRTARIRALIVVGLVALILGPNWLGIQKDAAFGQYHYRLGVIAEREGRVSEAAEEYEAALEIDPRVARANINLGILAARQGDLARADQLLERGAALDPRSARAHLARGQIAEVRGEYDVACSHYARSWEVDSTFVRGLESLMAARYVMGEIDVAAHTARELIKRAGDQPITVRAHFVLQRLDERQRSGVPVRSSIHRARADLALAAGNPQEALAGYRRALEHLADDTGAVLELARLYARLGDAEQAALWRERFMAMGGAASLLD